MNNVNKTLYIPLYGKAFVSRRGLFLEDKKAEEIWDQAGFPLTGRAKSKWLAFYMGMRSVAFDAWVEEQLRKTSDAVVVHLGCGLDSRVLRIHAENTLWFDVDFPEVISERKRFFSENDTYRMIGCDIRLDDWLDDIPHNKNAIIVMEGISMYLKPEELEKLRDRLCTHFDNLVLLLDCYSVLAAKLSKYKNPINEVGVSVVYGMDDPDALSNHCFDYVKEHEMTPSHCIDTLEKTERIIFRKLYAGRTSRKLYHLFEYRKYPV